MNERTNEYINMYMYIDTIMQCNVNVMWYGIELHKFDFDFDIEHHLFYWRKKKKNNQVQLQQ